MQAHTSSMPSSVRRSSEAGHSGRLRVVSRSWTKLSNSGRKSSSSLLLQHLGTMSERVCMYIENERMWVGVKGSLVSASHIPVFTALHTASFHLNAFI